MENILPELYQDITKCYILGEEFEESDIDIAVCTVTGQLLEFALSRVVNSCDLKCKDALKIIHFRSYTPLCKYYLIHCPSHVVVVSRKQRLEVIKRLSNVIDFEVTDFLRTGKPQVVIRVNGSDEPIITDFSEVVSCNSSYIQPTVLPDISFTLSAKLQEMSVRLEKTKHLLKDKQQCRNNTIGQFLHASRCETVKDLDVPLKIGIPWQRIHEDQWILGVPLHNQQQRYIENINLLLSMEKDAVSKLAYKTYLMVFDKDRVVDTNPLHFQKVTNVTGNTSAVLAGVIDVPRFTKGKTVRITGSVTYEEQDDFSNTMKQIYFPTVELTAVDLIEGKLRTFSGNEITACDFVSVVVTSQSYMFDVHLDHSLEPLLSSMLFQYLGFIYFPSMNCYICKQQSSLSGTMIILHQQTQQHYTMRLYARSEEQALLFIHGLYSLLPHHSKIAHHRIAEKNICSAAHSFKSELKLLSSLSNFNNKTLPISQSTVNLTREQWQSIYTKMVQAANVTDTLFKDSQEIS